MKNILQTGAHPEPDHGSVYRDLFQCAPDAVLLAGNGRIVAANPAACRLFGCGPEELNGLDLRDLEPACQPDGGSSEEKRLRFLADGREDGIRPCEWEYARRDGTRFTAEASFSRSVIDGNDHLLCVLRSIADRTGGTFFHDDLLEGVSDVIVVYDRTAVITWASPSAERILGRPPADYIGRSSRDFIHPDDLPQARLRLTDALADPARTFTYSVRIRAADGRWRVMEAASRNLLDHPRVRGIVVTLRDITERTVAEETLAWSERRYRTLFNGSPVSVWECDITRLRERISAFMADGATDIHALLDGSPDLVESALGNIVVTTANDASISLFEADTMGHLLGSARSVFESVERSALRQFLHAYIDGRPSFEQEVTVQTLRGNRREVILRATLAAAADFGPTLLLSFVDLTGRRSAEAALRNLIAQSPEMIIVADESGRTIEFNGSAEALTGIERDTALGMEMWHLFQVMTPSRLRTLERTTRVEESLRASLEKGEIDSRFSQWAGSILHTSGSERKVDAVNFCIRTSRGTQIGCIARDITERAAAEEEIARLQEQVHQAKKMEALGRLAGGVAHDFNNLLTSIIANADLVLMNETVGGEVREIVEEIEAASYRAADLTQHLLAFSRKQAQEQKVIDLNKSVADMEKMLRRIIGEDIRLECRLEAPLSLVSAAPAQVEQILLNLAVNARDAMPRGGAITVVTSTALRTAAGTGRDCVILSVMDSGCGMPEEVKSHLFEPFFTTKAAGSGTGLGLATVYGIVQQMGGDIAVDSTVGMGTTVRVSFPLVDAKPGAAEIPSRTVRSVPGRGDILVAEDDETLLKVIVKTLQVAGYTVSGFTDPIDALTFATTAGSRVDLLIADMVMPGMSGIQLASGVTDARPSARVLYISGYTQQAEKEMTTDSRGGGFLAKPFSLNDLNRKVHEILAEVGRPAGPAGPTNPSAVAEP